MGKVKSYKMKKDKLSVFHSFFKTFIFIISRVLSIKLCRYNTIYGNWSLISTNLAIHKKCISSHQRKTNLAMNMQNKKYAFSLYQRKNKNKNCTTFALHPASRNIVHNDAPRNFIYIYDEMNRWNLIYKFDQ